MTSYYSFPPKVGDPTITPGSTHSLYNYLFKVQSTYTSGNIPNWMGHPFSTDSAYSENVYTGPNDTNYMQFHDGSSVLKMGDIMYGSLKFNDGGGTTNIEIFKSDGGGDYSSYFAGKVTSLKTEVSDQDNTLATKSYYDEIGAELEATIQEYKDIVFAPVPPTSWTFADPGSINAMRSLAYGDGRFVGVGWGAAAYSFDGIDWSLTSVPQQHASYTDVTYGNGLFVAITIGSLNNSDQNQDRIMHSPDGQTWTSQSGAEENAWKSITYGGGKFVAIASNGDHRVMWSTDGVTWNAADATAQFAWSGVTYGNGKFVAVSENSDNTSERVMYSSDAITWTPAVAANEIAWYSVTYGNGKFVAVSPAAGNVDQVMWSTDAINWVPATAVNQNDWQTVTFGDGQYVATSLNDTYGDQIMYSTDAITWTGAAATSPWRGWVDVVYGGDKFVAVGRDMSNYSTDSYVMYSTDV